MLRLRRKTNNMAKEIQRKRGVEGFDYVICAVCGEKLKQITFAHLQKHSMTFEEYLVAFPDRLWRCEKLQGSMTDNQVKSQYNNDKNKCKVCGVPIAWNRTYCSSKCAVVLKKAPLVSHNCIECGTQFYTNIFNEHTFCSRLCYDTFRSSNKKIDMKEETRKKFDYRCALCDGFENLRVHHIDGNNKNNIEENLILLCEQCYRKIHNGTFITVYRSVRIEIAHQLPKHPKCHFLHGHSLEVVLGIRGKLNLVNGMVIDFGELKTILEVEVKNKFDHSCLNDVFKIPTMEILSFYLFTKLRSLGLNVVSIRIHETNNNFVEFASGASESETQI